MNQAQQYSGKILVATDFSEVAEFAFPYAEYEAAVAGASIDLLNVLEGPAITFAVPHYLPSEEEIRKMRVEAKRQAQDKLEEISSLKFKKVTAKSVVVEHMGSTADAIIEQAATGGYGLIVLSTQGRGFAHRAMVGSVAEGVLRQAPCPVLVIPPKVSVTKGASSHLPYKQIIVTTDFSDPSKEAFGIAVAEAARSKAEISLLHVMEDPLNFQVKLTYPEGQIAEIRARYREGLEEYMRQFADKEFPGQAVRSEVVKEQHGVAKAITDYAWITGSDLIVMSTRGASNRVMLFAGVVERVVREAHCPVMVVPTVRSPVLNAPPVL